METVRTPTRSPEMADIQIFTTGSELRRHYRAVRRRIETARPKPVVLLLSYTPPAEPEPPAPPPAPPPDKLVDTEIQSRAAIIRAVSQVMNVPLREMQSPRRHRDLVRARFVYYSMARHYTVASLPQIGITAGGRDHSTVFHGILRASDMIDELWPHYVAACALLGVSYPKREYFVVAQ